MLDNEIIQLIDKIRKRYDRIYDPSGNIVRIETDLILADIRNLYEKLSSPVVSELEHYTISENSQAEVDITHDEVPVNVVEISETISSPPVTSEKTEVDASVEPVLIFDQPEDELAKEQKVESVMKTEPIEEIHSQVLPIDTVAEQEPVIPGKIPVQVEFHDRSIFSSPGLDLFGAPMTTLADKFGEEKRSVNEKLHSDTNEDKSLGSKLKQPISDLKTAIGINDRFLFINELFDGDMREYDEALKSFNACASLQDAISIFEHAKNSRKWTNDLESVNKLLDFIHRRYA
jgi:hypothetical protein